MKTGGIRGFYTDEHRVETSLYHQTQEFCVVSYID